MKLPITFHRTTPRRDFIESLGIGATLTGLAYAIGILFGWITPESLNWLEVFAVFTSYSCTYLCVKERRINYPIGVVSTAAYALLFFQNGLVASAILNIYLVPTLVYGWFRWRKDSNTRPVEHVTPHMVVVYVLVALIGYLGAVFIGKLLSGMLTWTDSVILAGTILAQFLLDNKKLETWFVWALVNIFAIYTYASSGLSLVAFQYVFFLLNTFYGYITWKRSMLSESLRTTNGNATNHGTPRATTVR